MKRKMSKHPTIQAGWYTGLRKEIIEKTGISDPTVRKALRNNDTSTPTCMTVIETALELVKEHKAKVESMAEAV